MTTILIILGGCYGAYCVTFCCSVGYTLIKEHLDKKKEKELLIKKNYQKFYLEEKTKELENFERKLSYQNVKLETIQEEISEENSIKNEDLVVSNKEVIIDVDEKTQLCNQNYIISIRK